MMTYIQIIKIKNSDNNIFRYPINVEIVEETLELFIAS
jgi:hypothetical protein